jgi:hypothetical protein
MEEGAETRHKKLLKKAILEYDWGKDGDKYEELEWKNSSMKDFGGSPKIQP